MLGDWQVLPDRHVIINGDIEQSLEPKVIELLLLLAAEPGKVISRYEIEKSIWGDVVVGEDTVARLISKLRRAFGEKAQSPDYIQTIQKRGYRLMQTPSFDLTGASSTSENKVLPPNTKRPRKILALALLTMLLAYVGIWHLNSSTEIEESRRLPELLRADDFYMKFTYADNETAIKLYESVLATDSDNVRAQAGLANALVQRVIRWPDGQQISLTGADSLQEALKQNLHLTDFGQNTLKRATGLAERSVRLAPSNPDILKALGLTYTAQGRVNEAKAVYEKAISLDPDAWESMINLGEIYQIRGQDDKARIIFTQAYEAMDRNYASEPQKIAQWQAPMGNVIAQLHLQQGRSNEAEIWYRRVLTLFPLDKNASIGLAALLRVNGDSVQASEICRELQNRLGDVTSC